MHSVKGTCGSLTKVTAESLCRVMLGVCVRSQIVKFWHARGIDPQVLPEQMTVDHRTLMKLSVLGPGWQAAGSILGMLDRPQEASEKTGNCLDPDEPSAWTDTERCGGTPRKRADHSHSLVVLGCSGRNGRGQVARGVETWPISTILPRRPSCRSSPTQLESPMALAGSSGSFFCLLGSRPFPQQRNNEWRTNNGSSVSACSCTKRMGRTAQGIRQRLSGVRHARISSTFRTPFKGGLGSGLLQGPPLGCRDRPEAAALWSARCLGWVFHA